MHNQNYQTSLLVLVGIFLGRALALIQEIPSYIRKVVIWVKQMLQSQVAEFLLLNKKIMEAWQDKKKMYWKKLKI